MDSLSETLDTALDIVKPSDKKVVLDKNKTNGSKVEITDNHKSNGTEEVQDSETSLEKVSQVSESQNNTHHIDLDENSNTKSSDVEEKTDLINVQNSDDKGDGEKHVSFNLNQNSIPDHLTCTEQLECRNLENKVVISNHDGHSEEMQADDSSQSNTTETVDSKSALAVASADSESTVSVINSVVKTEQEVNNFENNQNEETIAKTESVTLASADSESTVSIINSVSKTDQEVNNSENNQIEATSAKTESVNNQNEATVSKTESVIKQDHEVTIDSFVNDSATGADAEMSEEEIQDLHLRVDIFRFLLPGLCHLTSEDISRSVLIQEGILALLDLYMWRQWNLFNQDPQNKEIQVNKIQPNFHGPR